MDIRTYDPIGDIHVTKPMLKPGERLVVSREGEYWDGMPDGMDFLERLQEIFRIQIVIPAIFVIIVLVYFFGFIGFLISLALILVFYIYIFFNRTGQVSLFFLGQPAKFIIVDMSQHTITDRREVELSQTAVFVEIRIQYDVSVKDAVEVVRQGVRDVREKMSLRINKKLKKLAKKGTFADKIRALRAELSKYEEEGEQNELFEITNLSLDAIVDPDIARKLLDQAVTPIDEESAKAALRRILADAKVNKGRVIAEHEERTMRIEFEKALLLDDNSLRAAMLSPNADPALYQEVLRQRVEDKTRKREQNERLLKYLYEAGWLEAHVLKRDFPGFVEGIISGVVRGVSFDELPQNSPEPNQEDDPPTMDGEAKEVDDDTDKEPDKDNSPPRP